MLCVCLTRLLKLYITLSSFCFKSFCLFVSWENKQTNPESLLKESMNSLDRAASSPLLARITMRSQKVGSWQRFAAKLSEPSFRQKAVQQDPSSKCLIKKNAKTWEFSGGQHAQKHRRPHSPANHD